MNVQHSSGAHNVGLTTYWRIQYPYCFTAVLTQSILLSTIRLAGYKRAVTFQSLSRSYPPTAMLWHSLPVRDSWWQQKIQTLQCTRQTISLCFFLYSPSQKISMRLSVGNEFGIMDPFTGRTTVPPIYHQSIHKFICAHRYAGYNTSHSRFAIKHVYSDDRNASLCGDQLSMCCTYCRSQRYKSGAISHVLQTQVNETHSVHYTT